MQVWVCFGCSRMRSLSLNIAPSLPCISKRIPSSPNMLSISHRCVVQNCWYQIQEIGCFLIGTTGNISINSSFRVSSKVEIRGKVGHFGLKLKLSVMLHTRNSKLSTQHRIKVCTLLGLTYHWLLKGYNESFGCLLLAKKGPPFWSKISTVSLWTRQKILIEERKKERRT